MGRKSSFSRHPLKGSIFNPKNGLLIQMIHNGGGFFGSYPKPDTLDT